MSRVKLTIPPNKIFAISLSVRISDVNHGNHLGHDALITMLQEARVQWLAHHQYNELDIEGTGLIMADIAVEYKAESHFNDVLDISLYADDVATVNFDLYYVVKNQDDKLIAKAKTGMICFDYAEKKILKMPTQLLKILNI